VAVVGAGVAGLTAAAGLTHAGAAVTLLEKEPDILPLFRRLPDRWLHPNAYDWPAPGWDHPRAGLPLLDWGEGLVKDVATELRAAWAAAGKGVRLITRGENTQPLQEDGGVVVTWNEAHSWRALDRRRPHRLPPPRP